MKIATWNVNSLTVRLPHALEWLSQNAVDVLAIQETKLVDERFPVDAFQKQGYDVCYVGQKTYNGMAIISRLPMQEILKKNPYGENDEQCRFLAVTIHQYRIINIYVPNGAAVGSDKYHYKLRWLEQLHQFLKNELIQYERVVLLGDFNIAPAEVDVSHPKDMDGGVLVSPRERAAFAECLKLGFVDAFRLFSNQVEPYSWWDYRTYRFQKDRGARIDHVLVSSALVPQCRKCFIDKTPRNWERPSDHAPVIGEFVPLNE